MNQWLKLFLLCALSFNVLTACSDSDDSNATAENIQGVWESSQMVDDTGSFSITKPWQTGFNPTTSEFMQIEISGRRIMLTAYDEFGSQFTQQGSFQLDGSRLSSPAFNVSFEIISVSSTELVLARSDEQDRYMIFSRLRTATSQPNPGTGVAVGTDQTLITTPSESVFLDVALSNGKTYSYSDSFSSDVSNLNNSLSCLYDDQRQSLQVAVNTRGIGGASQDFLVLKLPDIFFTNSSNEGFVASSPKIMLQSLLSIDGTDTWTGGTCTYNGNKTANGNLRMIIDCQNLLNAETTAELNAEIYCQI